jgi:signal transduction histidine kinase
MNRMSRGLLEADRKLRAEEEARRQAEEELRHAERLATIGELAAGVAHELGTPLNVISGRAKVALRSPGQDRETRRVLSIIQEQTVRMTHIIQQLLHFARRTKPTRTAVDLYELVSSTLDVIGPTLKPDVRLVLQEDEVSGTRTSIDARQIEQILTNLVTNAAQAMPSGGRLSVSLSVRHVHPPAGHGGQAGEYFCLSVRDEGDGISEKDLPHVFEPFFTTKAIGEGTGLGLAVARGLVEAHGGWIAVESAIGVGTCFTVYLPRDRPGEETLEAPSFDGTWAATPIHAEHA